MLQVAVAALGALEAVPPHRVERMLADGALGARIMACLSSASREVPFPCIPEKGLATTSALPNTCLRSY